MAALAELRIRLAPFPLRSRRLPQVQHRQSKGLPTLELDPNAQRTRFEPSLLEVTRVFSHLRAGPPTKAVIRLQPGCQPGGWRVR
jgi:hypothetical protein